MMTQSLNNEGGFHTGCVQKLLNALGKGNSLLNVCNSYLYAVFPSN